MAPEPARLPIVLGMVLAVAVTILAIMTVSNKVLAHDIYSNLRDRAGHLCCTGQDCRPVEAAVLPGGNDSRRDLGRDRVKEAAKMNVE